jgi:hypothetical protein
VTATTASSEAPGLVLSASGVPTFTVASTASSVRSYRDPVKGQVTISMAEAQGVVAGPVAIREVRSVAIARAKGRTGTAAVDFERRWCGITLAGEDPLPSTSTSPTSSTTTSTSTTEALTVVVPSPPEVPKGAASGCIDPTDPVNAEFMETLNRSLLGKLRLSVPDANGKAGGGEASPGGFQAVLTKHADQRGGDLVVNDDDTHAVAALEATYYNDGAEGRNRVVVQLASVHAEARYGITVVPDFGDIGGFDSGDDGSFEGGSEPEPSPPLDIPPAEEWVEEGEIFEIALAGEDLPFDELVGGNPISRLLRTLPDALGDVLRLLIQHPREFALLMLVFAILGSPPYLAYRRRQFAGLVGG